MGKLIECPDCGKQISPRAPTCPQCGAPRETAEASSGFEEISANAPHGKGKAPNLELVGFVIILISMGGCAIGMVGSQMGFMPFGIGAIGFIIGLGVFIAGRFQKGLE